MPVGDTAWHALPLPDLLALVGTDPVAGLTGQEACRRLADAGENLLAEPPPPPRWRRFLAQFREFVVWVLLAAGAISAVIGDWPDAAVIAAIVLVNAVIGFLQEERATRALAALQRIAAPLARVVRDGVVLSIPARGIVVGDRIELEAGDRVPADGRLVEGFGLRLQESALTGESEPVEKRPGDAVPAAAPLGERTASVHAGTVVAAGRGAAVVVATGMRTELGRIATLLEDPPAEFTPLQRRLAELGRVMVAACAVVVTVIVLLELRRGGGLGEILVRALSLAVAAVPEGLPAVVTVVLAIGVQRMAARNALVRRLPSVETLGSVTVICSDKTGTLTCNEMTVREVHAGGRRYRVTGSGYVPRGGFEPLGSSGPAASAAMMPGGDPDLGLLLRIALACNNATVLPGADGCWRALGDPTEAALVVAAMKAGLDPAAGTEPTLYEIPFDSGRKRMSVVVRRADGGGLYTKGGPESVLDRCVAEHRDGGTLPLEAGRRREILEAATDMASRALRVLAFAWRPVPLDGLHEAEEESLVFVGLVGMIDPPREEARQAVQTCRAAGIRPVMITGDHPATARAIGRELGLMSDSDGLATGPELDAMADETLAERVDGIAVYARASAEHKLRVVRAWQGRGDVVAMTGDGVNDAPAVQAADIGIAMGIAGTDVTKESSDMVLTDDNFASIVSAVEEGRGIYDNVQKVVHYLLACNAGEVVVMFVAALVGWPAPLTAIQILWLNLVTDGLPALALGMEPPERDLMSRAPRSPHAPVISAVRGVEILLHGLLVAAVTLVGFHMSGGAGDASVDEARTVTFCVAAFSQLLFAIACRSDRLTAVSLGVFRNPALLVAIAVSTLLQVTVVMLPQTQSVFASGHMPARTWLLVAGLAVVPVTVVEIVKSLAATVTAARSGTRRDRPVRRGS
jgi:Ca2+-transporting ATPase